MPSGRTISFAALLAAASLAASAQQPMGTVATQDALITGGLEVQGNQARLLTNASVTAHDHTAVVTLGRGGQALVCATSEFHLLRSGKGDALLFGLNRGALELHTQTEPQDIILTPDIRFALETPGIYDLRLRVTRDGDTCVDNAGKSSPVLLLSDSFSSASYRLMPGQHVLFEHGSLHEVVDHERSPCGCPTDTPTHLGPNATPSETAAAQHPFPSAQSEGLAPSTPIPPGTSDSTIAFNNRDATSNEPSSANPSAPTAPPSNSHGFFHALGHFLKKLFTPSD
jgi:hypothetical protein